MIIVPIDNLREGMVLAKDVASTSATDYRTLLMRGTFLTTEMIAMLRARGIKSVNIVGDREAVMAETAHHQEMVEQAELIIEEELELPEEEPVAPAEPTPEEVKNQHIGHALNELNNIFDENHEVKELSQEAVQKVSDIADDIIADISNDATYLGNQMIALQNYDDYTYKHCLRVAMLATSVAANLGLSRADAKDVVTAALLHDIGKSSIDHDIIIKPSKLTESEFEEIKRHPYIGYNILKNSGEKTFSPNVLSGVLFHHEKYDGSGYPTGIKDKDIPLIGRIIAVCDVFDALTSNRPYRKPWSVAEAEEYILGASGSHFDFDITSAFLRAFNPYPVGTMVSLSDGRHGIVIETNQNVLRPTIRIQGENSGEEIDLSSDFRFLSVMVTGIYGGQYPKFAE